ncbi:de-hypoxanthine futalosine cyclase [Thermodesulfobium acidiphilum]|uniref:De-hypoxanthine futalosine cyclase n=1 Tax=Thermodesulfobium acidiphilum TaxID=1794699 RepID=A0A2R4VYV6_THEAF|nr:CofH family radical SAM protein [Thermodesulfobium acidiphilum]AWB09630.1 de-hypoxanthine futalosine cyclase [Thermodesulfobium acidiphilum]
MNRSDLKNLIDNPIDLFNEANKKKSSLYGKNVFFAKNIHLNLTNICVERCGFCPFARNKDDFDAYKLSPEVVASKLQGLTWLSEVHITSGLNPDLKWNEVLKILDSIRKTLPKATIKSLTAVEVEFYAKEENKPIESIIEDLLNHGSVSLTGGGAEILKDSMRTKLLTKKTSPEMWLKIHEIAHKIGLKSNATMLYGHFETFDDILEHLNLLEDLQQKTGGFQAFIPLKFQPLNTKFRHIKPATSIKTLKTIAISRLVLSIPHIKAYWPSIGQDCALMALWTGADDLEGTLVDEKIMHEGGSPEPGGLSAESLKDMITNIGLVPFERNSLYEKIG